ncbi:MAG: formylglycine-generating enzyme family protein, partial [Muribaculaceae bacterium]
MSGNVYEWCSDWFGNYSNEATTNPTGSKNGFYRVNRGGSWFNSDKFCRVSYRICNTSDNRYDNLGLRLCIPLR